MQQAINLEDNISVNGVFRMASDMVSKAFGQKSPKLPNPCTFLKENKLKHYRYKTLRSGDVQLSVVTEDGYNYYAKARNFSLAYIRLVRNFRAV